MSSARVVIASTRAAAGTYEDRCGPIIVDWLGQRGFAVPDPMVVADGDRREWGVAGGDRREPRCDHHVRRHRHLADGCHAGSDGRECSTIRFPGLADAIRRAGLPKVPTAVLSRGICGVAGRTLVINLPGSPGGVRDGLAVLDDVLDHALDQLRGKDHT